MSNNSDILFDKLLPEQFKPFFSAWQTRRTSLLDHFDLVDYCVEADACLENRLAKKLKLYINPKNEHCVVVKDKRHFFYLYFTGNFGDAPKLHRLFGPARYTADGSISKLHWYLYGREYSEFDYWFKVSQLFSDYFQLCLSCDETRLFLYNQNRCLPIPDRLNLQISALEHTEDQMRKELTPHVVWCIEDEEYVSPERFWTYWEQKGFDLKTLF